MVLSISPTLPPSRGVTGLPMAYTPESAFRGRRVAQQANPYHQQPGPGPNVQAAAPTPAPTANAALRAALSPAGRLPQPSQGGPPMPQGPPAAPPGSPMQPPQMKTMPVGPRMELPGQVGPVAGPSFNPMPQQVGAGQMAPQMGRSIPDSALMEILRRLLAGGR